MTSISSASRKRALRGSIDWRQACRLRLASQFLTTVGPNSPEGVVHALGAVQSQDYAGATWALGQRIRDATQEHVERAFTNGSILRTHVLRPTWHFVAPSDIRWMLALTAPRVKSAMSSYNRKLELTDAVFRRSNAAIAKALEGGSHLTRTELRHSLERARIGAVSGQRLAHVVMQAELDAVICSGPRRGKQFTYALLEERVPPAPHRERDEALLELTLRYFKTRGPATSGDFAWWSGLRVADARRGMEIAGKALQRVTMGDEAYWLDAEVEAIPTSQPSAHLLPNYDEYFIGYKNRDAIGQRVRDAGRVDWGNPAFAHVVAVDGQLVGGWRRAVAKDGVRIDMTLVTRLSASERRRVAAAATRLAGFLGVAVRVNAIA